MAKHTASIWISGLDKEADYFSERVSYPKEHNMNLGPFGDLKCGTGVAISILPAGNKVGI